MKHEYDPEFSSWYAKYPRRVGKLDAQKAWRRAVKHATPDEINSATDRMRKEWAGRKPEMVPHAATFLRGNDFNERTELLADDTPPLIQDADLRAKAEIIHRDLLREQERGQRAVVPSIEEIVERIRK